MIIEVKPNVYTTQDPGNQQIQNRVNSKQITLALFGATEYAMVAGSRMLRAESYPLAQIRKVMNRNAFRLQAGDKFVYSDSNLGITNMVFTVVSIEDDNLEKETITVTAIEAIEYISGQMEAKDYFDNVAGASQGGGAPQDGAAGPQGITGVAALEDTSIDPLTETAVIEAPYGIVTDDTMKIITLANRETGREIGYNVHISSTGASYKYLNQSSSYCKHATLMRAYALDTHNIDDKFGFLVEFDDTDLNVFSTITRAELFTDVNLCLLGNELIAVQTVTPVEGTKYLLTGIRRGIYDTEQAAHAINEDFYYLGESFYGLFEDSSKFDVGANRYFKLNPFSLQWSADISLADVSNLTFTGRAKTPYKPSVFRANERVWLPMYVGDIILLWNPRRRTFGAGMGIPDVVLGTQWSWEGLFEIEVYVSDVLVRTETAIDARTWIYTEAMNISDNSGLANEVTFKLKNYIEETPYTYSSDWNEILVRKRT